MRTLVVGALAFDQFFHYEGSFLDGLNKDTLESLSVSYYVPRGERSLGGDGGNKAWALALFGETPYLVSTLGYDGASYKEKLESINVDMHGVKTHEDCLSALAVIATDKDGHQITFFHPGSYLRLAWEPPTDHKDIKHAIVGPARPDVTLEVLRWCRQKGIRCIFDPGQQLLGFSKQELWEAIHLCTGLMVNEYEWSLIEEQLSTSAEELVQDTIFDDELTSEDFFLVVTRGENGFSLYETAGVQNFAGCKADTFVNPTGAGDTFRAGFLAGMNRGWPLTDCGKIGAAAASFVVEHESPMLDKMDMEKLQRRIKQAYGEELPLQSSKSE